MCVTVIVALGMVVSIRPYIDTRSILRYIPPHRKYVVPMSLTFLVRKRKPWIKISDVISIEDWEQFIKWRKAKTNSTWKSETNCCLATLYRKEVLRYQNTACTQSYRPCCIWYSPVSGYLSKMSREVNGSRKRAPWSAFITPYSSGITLYSSSYKKTVGSFFLFFKFYSSLQGIWNRNFSRLHGVTALLTETAVTLYGSSGSGY